MVVVNRLSLASRLAGAASLAILAAAATPVVIMAGTDLGIGASIGLTGLAVIAGTGAVMLGFRAMLGPLDGVGRDLDIVARELATRDTFSRAQNSLDRNLGLLREALAAYGQPRRVGDQLFFGDTLINGDFTVVDQVRATAGGAATVFLGDMRVSTNVTKPDGSRAVGTALAAGPVHEAVLGGARGYRGEAEILGETYFAIYEPITSQGTVIGVLFVGVKKADFVDLAQGKPTDVAHGIATQLARSTTLFRGAAESQAAVERDAIRMRQESEDARRRQDMALQRDALGQAEVVDALSAALSRLSAGDLSRDVHEAFPDQYGRLKSDFNAALAALRETMGEVTEGCRTMRQGTSEISQASDDLSRRTEHQAATLEETAAASDQITATVRATAEAADRAGTIVQLARDRAEHSGEVVREAGEAMQRIQQSSTRIGTIIDVIDEIAMQTNLLALNAAVEAARAGEAGRGFAVVASEVRTLAQRSAAAATEIKALVSESASEVTGGVGVVRQAGEALGSIAGAVIEINDAIHQIASGAREQATSLDMVNNAINEMDRVTQQNAAMVEQSTAASHLLLQQSDRLASMVERFDVGAAQSDHPVSHLRAA